MSEQEVIERIAQVIEPIMYPDYYPVEVRKDASIRIANQIFTLIKELGYRQIPESLPVLTDEQIFNALLKVASSRDLFSIQIPITEQRQLSATAQRDADLKRIWGEQEQKHE